MFDIYGIGNALVDSEVEVTNDELSQCGIEKGVMSLIQEDRLQELKKRFSGTRVRRACGGSAANTIISATLPDSPAPHTLTTPAALRSVRSRGPLFADASHAGFFLYACQAAIFLFR